MNMINTTYGQNARFDTGRPMTRDELYKAAPSVFAVTKHDSRTERFSTIPTIEIVDELARHGYGVFGAKQSTTRVPGKAAFTKHMLRIRAIDSAVKHMVGGTVHEMLLKNANDGTSPYDLMSALFRIACLNSMVTLLDTLDSFKVRHTGPDIMGRVIEGTYTVVENSKLALAAPEQWSQIKLDREESLAMAEAAREIRFGHVDESGAVVVDAPI